MSSETTIPRDQVLDDVKRIVGEHMGIAPETIRATDDLVADIGCDSLDIAEITMEVEDHFGITVPDEVGEDVRTIGDMADGVLELLGQLPADSR